MKTFNQYNLKKNQIKKIFNKRNIYKNNLYKYMMKSIKIKKIIR